MTEPTTSVTTVAEGTARITWTPDEPIDVIRHHVVAALVDHARVEALVDPDDEGAQRAATWSGLRREGVMRGVTVDGDPVDRVVYARLATDTPLNEPEGFRALLNSFLPRKRAIGQMLVRDPDGRVLLCQLTYKPDWDLPGGVVEVNESPAAGRRPRDRGGARPRPPRGRAGAHRLAAAVERLGRRALPGLRRRRPRRLPHRRDRARGPRDPLGRVLHRSSRSPSAAPTSPPAGSSPPSPTSAPAAARRTPSPAARAESAHYVTLELGARVRPGSGSLWRRLGDLAPVAG